MRIRAEIVGDDLRLVVENECDEDRPEILSTGIGLQNVRSRLQTLYPDDARVDYKEANHRFVVELRLPALVELGAADSVPAPGSSRNEMRAERSTG